MDEFKKLLENADILEKIKRVVPEQDHELFDKIVEEKVKEYSEIWNKIKPEVHKYREGAIKDVRSSESEPTDK